MPGIVHCVVAQDAAIAAFQAGNSALTLQTTEHATALARAMPDSPPIACAFALNNLANFLSTSGNDLDRDQDRASALSADALTKQRQAGQLASGAGITALTQLAAHEARHGPRDQALGWPNDALALTRGTDLHGGVVATSAISTC